MKKITKAMMAAAVAAAMMSVCTGYSVSAADSVSESAAEAEVSTAYTFTCIDNEGNPVQGVRLQVCSDVQCYTMKTDADGSASLDAAENGVYTLHVVKVPEGYEYQGEAEVAVEGPYHNTQIELMKTEAADSKAAAGFAAEASEAEAADHVTSAAAAESMVESIAEEPASTEIEVEPYQLTFTTVDLEGNEVTSDELYAGYDLILINLWEDWCSPCKRELPALAKLFDDNADRKIGVIGVVNPYENDFSTTEQVKELIAENGINYPVIKWSEDFDEIDSMGGRPTSVFVDGEGNVIPLTNPEFMMLTRDEVREQTIEMINGYVEMYLDGELEAYKDSAPENYELIEGFAEDPDSIDDYADQVVDEYMAADDLMDSYISRIGEYGQFVGSINERCWTELFDYMYDTVTAAE